jgi:hypothetical protein
MSAEPQEVAEQRGPETEWVLKVAGILITLLALGGPAALTKLLDEYQILTLWQVFALTAPMTVAVTIIVGSWFSDTPLSVVATLAVILVTGGIAYLIGLHSARPVADAFGLKQCHFNLYDSGRYETCLRNSTPSSLPDAAARVVGAYWKVYGWRLFLESLIAGSALAFLAQVALPRYLRERAARRDAAAKPPRAA